MMIGISQCDVPFQWEVVRNDSRDSPVPGHFWRSCHPCFIKHSNGRIGSSDCFACEYADHEKHPFNLPINFSPIHCHNRFSFHWSIVAMAQVPAFPGSVSSWAFYLHVPIYDACQFTLYLSLLVSFPYDWERLWLGELWMPCGGMDARLWLHLPL